MTNDEWKNYWIGKAVLEEFTRQVRERRAMAEQLDIEREHRRLLFEASIMDIAEELYTVRFFKLDPNRGLIAPAHSTIKSFDIMGVNDFREMPDPDSGERMYVMCNPDADTLRYAATGSGFYSCYNLFCLRGAINYWDHYMESADSQVLLGICRVSGEVHVCDTGVRSEKLEIMSLYTPHRMLQTLAWRVCRIKIQDHQDFPKEFHRHSRPTIWDKLITYKPVTDDDRMSFPKLLQYHEYNWFSRFMRLKVENILPEYRKRKDTT